MEGDGQWPGRCAVVHSDALLCLDEIAQLSNSKEAGDVAYMLANGQGKSRASRDATLRRLARWKTLFLSTGEVSLADKIAEDQRGRRQTAGQAVRVIDLPSDTGRYGLFDDLHGFPSASAFAEHFLRGACDKYYGTAARAFIKAIAPKLEHIASIVKEGARQFVDDNCGDDCDGQVKRVAAPREATEFVTYTT